MTKNDYPTRIELLFEILSGVKNTELDRYAIYRRFADMAKEGDLSHIWTDIKKIFLTFKFWFKDIEYYHLVGFLVASNILSIEKIYNAAKDKTKNELRDFLKDTIKNNLRLSLNLKEEEIKIDNISGLSYDDDKDKKNIEKILLLFNIATILNQKGSYVRFSFNEFNAKKWSLEHIHVQNDKGLKDKEAQDAWLSSVEKYLDDSKTGDKQLAEMIGSFKEDNKRNDFFALQIEILNRFGDKELLDIHGIENLALLTAENNSSLSNGPFIEKREKIIEMDKDGEFIPICTKNVFLKYYSNELSNVYFWSKQDQEDYKGSIIKTLENFFGEKNGK